MLFVIETKSSRKVPHSVCKLNVKVDRRTSLAGSSVGGHISGAGNNGGGEPGSDWSEIINQSNSVCNGDRPTFTPLFASVGPPRAERGFRRRAPPFSDPSVLSPTVVYPRSRKVYSN